MTEKTWKCPLCLKPTPLKTKEKHLEAHVKKSYVKEVEAFHETQRAAALLKKVTQEVWTNLLQ